MRGDTFWRRAAPLAAVAAAIFAFGVGLSVAQAEDAKPADTTKPATTTPPAATTPAKPAEFQAGYDDDNARSDDG